MLAVAIILAAAMMIFGILGLVTSHRLHHHLQTEYREKHRHPRKEGDFSRGFGDVVRLHNYVWSYEDDDDAHVYRFRRRLRIAMVGVLASAILAAALIAQPLHLRD